MAKNAFFKNPKISPFRGPYERVFGPDGRKIGRLSGFWPKTYLWTEFHRNRGRWPYLSVTVSHGWPLKCQECPSSNDLLLTSEHTPAPSVSPSHAR